MQVEALQAAITLQQETSQQTMLERDHQHADLLEQQQSLQAQLSDAIAQAERNLYEGQQECSTLVSTSEVGEGASALPLLALLGTNCPQLRVQCCRQLHSSYMHRLQSYNSNWQQLLSKPGLSLASIQKR